MARYIDADLLLEKFSSWNEMKKAMMQIIGEVPTADVRPNVKGEWMNAKNGKYKCSVCLGKHTDPETGEWHEVFDFRYPFCPNCGADMRGEEQ